MAEVNIDSLEPNSHKYKAEKARRASEQKSREKIPPIIKRDSIVSTKKSLGKRFIETFVEEDVDDVKKWFFKEVLGPGIKNMFLDILTTIFFDKDDRRDSRREREHYDYRSRYRGTTSRENRNSRRRRDDSYASDDRVDFRNIVLRNRSDAEDVIEEMRKRIRDTDSVSVADLLDLIDVPGRYTDNNWGWDDERDIGIRRVSSGFLIDVAEPKYLD